MRAAGVVQRGCGVLRRVASRVRRSPGAFLSGAAVVVAGTLIGQLHAFFWNHAGQYGGDDGYTMALGERLIGGTYLPYVDGFSHRGPMLYWAAAVAQLLTGRFGWTGARVLSIATTYGTFLGVFAVGAVARRPLAGAVAALFFAWSVLTVLTVSPGYAITGEGVASPLAILSLLFTAAGLLRAVRPRNRLGALAVGGAFAALAGLAKQTALPIIGPLSLWTFAHFSQPEFSGRQRATATLSLASGFLGVLGIVILRYALCGQIHAFFYWYYAYNAHIYMAPYRGANFIEAFTGFMNKEPWAVGGFALSMAWAVGRPFAAMGEGRPRIAGLLRGYAAAGLECTAAWMALSLFASAVAPLRFWPHYFLPVFPFVGLVIGLRGEGALPLDREGRRAPVASLVLLALSTALLGFCVDRRLVQFRAEARHGQWQAETWEPACDVIAANSSPGDSLFVWGFSGDLYLTCRRRPASRYVYLTLVAGTVPPEWSVIRSDRVAEGARENLVSDLTKERPPVVLDVPEPMGNVSFVQIPTVREFIQARYCKTGKVRVRHSGTASIWIRKDLPACRRQMR